MYVVKAKFFAGGRTWKTGDTLEDGDAKALLGFSTLVEKGKLELMGETPKEETKGKQK